MSRYSCAYVTGSLLLTATFLVVGISFFAPYWLTGAPLYAEGNMTTTYITTEDINGTNITMDYPFRGLWAQCGSECVWFWEGGYLLQLRTFTLLKWHLATQVLYFIGAAIILITEIYSRIALCCCSSDNKAPHALRSIAALVLFSAILQLCSVAVFGGGAYRKYQVLSNPTQIDALNVDGNKAFLGWVFWMAVTGSLLSILSGIFFLIASCKCACCRRKA